jgi:hypothetical protein
MTNTAMTNTEMTNTENGHLKLDPHPLAAQPGAQQPPEQPERSGELAPLTELERTLRASLYERTEELRALRQRFEEFQTEVRDTAIRYAQAHNWCEVVDRALKEMGLEARTEQYEVTITVTGTIRTTVEATHEDDAAAQALQDVGIHKGAVHTLHQEQFTVTEVEVDVD